MARQCVSRCSAAVLIALGLAACAPAEPAGRMGPAAAVPEAREAAPPTADSVCAHGQGTACGAAARGHVPSEPPAPTANGERTFGTAPDAQRPLTLLSAILAEPERYRDQVVRTEGEIAQVCQRMGCWMELRERQGAPSIRVPMAGHSFFLPRDVAGRRAMMQGRVSIQPLSEGMRSHLAEEGATALASAVSIEASGVVVR